MSTNYNPQIVTSGLVLAIDAANPKSYSYAENLITFSQAINSGNGWSVGPNTTFISSANTAPNGSNTATSFFSNGSGGGIFLARSIGYAANTFYTASCWARLSNGSVPTNGAILTISYSTNVLGTQTRSVVGYNGNLTSSWQRFSTTFFNVAPGAYTAFFGADQTNTSTIEIWGAQIERGNTLNRYVATTGSAVVASNTMSDLSLTKNDGTLINLPGYNSSNSSFVFGGFDKGNSSISLTNNIPSNLSAMTVEVLVNPAPLVNQSIGYIIGQRNSVFRLMYTGSTYEWACATSNNAWYSAGTTLSMSLSPVYNVWRHVTIVYDGTNIKGYINGVLNNTSSGSISGTIFGTLAGLFIMNTDSANLDNGAGQLAIAKIYDRALSNTEIQQNFNAIRGRYGL
jgi:hypothetical protein